MMKENNLPKGFIPLESYGDEEGNIEYVIAVKSLKIRDTYYLFSLEEGKWKKVKSSTTSPIVLQNFIEKKKGKENER